LKKFTDKQKQKLYGIFLDDMDLKNMFVSKGNIGGSQPNKPNNASTKILKDKEIGPLFTACAWATTA
jgi:hypothetical protein